jgi:hypothetical protein
MTGILVPIRACCLGANAAQVGLRPDVRSLRQTILETMQHRLH